jgi:cardiolipin synthase
MIPAIVYYINNRYELAFFYLMLSGTTDVLDGLIARKFHMTSDLGIVLDPIADKLTQDVFFIAVAKSTPWMTALCILLIVKESIMGIGGLIVLRKTNKTYSANWYGKLANAASTQLWRCIFYGKRCPCILERDDYSLRGGNAVSLVLYCLKYVSILKKVNSAG